MNRMKYYLSKTKPYSPLGSYVIPSRTAFITEPNYRESQRLYTTRESQMIRLKLIVVLVNGETENITQKTNTISIYAHLL